MKRDVFVETSHVTALRAAVLEALNAGAGYPAMVMAYGEAGTGKTCAARKLYVELGGYYIRAFEGASQAAFLQDLCFEVTGARPHGAARCKMEIIRKLTDTPAPIFADEADRWHISRLEDLRDIHDLTGSPIILAGELGLPSRVSARGRINDRIPQSFRVNFGAVTLADVLLYADDAAGLRLLSEAGEAVFKHTKGNFRKLHNAILALEGAARAAGRAEVSGEMARAVLTGGRA